MGWRMGIEIGSAGETLAAVVISNELGSTPSPKPAPDGGTSANCANCGTVLSGAYCHACGQSSHIHRSLLHMLEEVLHGIFHFDTKAWRTIPALILRPGHLTKDYIEGKRTSYVSPLALFLFLIFLMFFVFSYTTSWKSDDLLKVDNSRESITEELAKAKETLQQKRLEKSQLAEHSADQFDLQIEIREAEAVIGKLQDTLGKLDGKIPTVAEAEQELAKAEQSLAALRIRQAEIKSAKSAETPDPASTTTASDASASAKDKSHVADPDVAQIKPWEIAQEIRFMERQVKYHKKRVASVIEQHKRLEKDQTSKATAASATKAASTNSASAVLASSPKTASSATDETEESTDDGTSDFSDLSKIPYIGKTLEHIDSNRELTLYKMKKNASSAAFLLIPISLPFLWLLFAFKRKYVMFDHTVFALYSLSFMSLLMIAVATLSKFEFTGTASMLFVFVPPIHMFSQLRHAYSLGVLASLWRTIALLFIALITLTIYAAVVTVLST